jgi:hypothetical protein
MIGIAVISFLVGTLFNMNYMVSGGDGNPWDKVWQAIYDLQAQVQSLNETIETLKTEMPKRPKIITNLQYFDPDPYHPSWTKLKVQGVWIDLISISDVTVPEGANVLAFFSANIQSYASLWLRHRANTTYGEVRSYTYTLEESIIEIHCTWENLTEGTYTFAVQYYLLWGEEGVRNVRLTLMIT